jgi:outer membrane protein insertion porin family
LALSGFLSLQVGTGGVLTPEKLYAQQPPTAPKESAQEVTLRSWIGLQVEAIEFKGVSADRLAPLPDQLALQPNQLLDSQKVRDSLRRLYETGLYRTIVVEGIRHGNAVTIIFSGTPSLFIGRVTVNGVNSERLSGVLERSARLNAGTTFSDNKLLQAQTLL